MSDADYVPGSLCRTLRGDVTCVWSHSSQPLHLIGKMRQPEHVIILGESRYVASTFNSNGDGHWMTPVLTRFGKGWIQSVHLMRVS